jgi:hypothetical protein
VERSCPACGRPRAEGDRYCAQCGRALDQDPQPTEPATPSYRGSVLPANTGEVAVPRRETPWRAVQSPWLITALVIATFNLYALWWLGRTWSQLKQEDGDEGKQPVWHVLAMVVPVYGYFRFHAHVRTIAQLAATPEARSTLSPGAMTFAWIVINVLSATALRADVPGWVGLLAGVLSGALLGWAQYGLNATWQSLPGGAVRARMHPLHWLLLILGFGLLTLGIIAPSTSEL